MSTNKDKKAKTAKSKAPEGPPPNNKVKKAPGKTKSKVPKAPPIKKKVQGVPASAKVTPKVTPKVTRPGKPPEGPPPKGPPPKETKKFERAPVKAPVKAKSKAPVGPPINKVKKKKKKVEGAPVPAKVKAAGKAKKKAKDASPTSKLDMTITEAKMPNGEPLFYNHKYTGEVGNNPHVKYNDQRPNSKYGPWNLSLTVRQMVEFTRFCIKQPLWDEVKGMHEQVGIPPARVSGYLMNKFFVKPYTNERGLGISLCMQKDYTKPLEAKVMLSWSWDSDMESIVDLLEEKVNSKQIILSDGSTFGWETPVFFCLFANYQGNGSQHAPLVAEQVKDNPFKGVLLKVNDLIILQIHAADFDLYRRKWCIYELGKALLRPEMKIFWIPTEEYITKCIAVDDPKKKGYDKLAPFDFVDNVLDLVAVDCKTALCGGQTDADMIDDDIDTIPMDCLSQKEGSDRVNFEVYGFRALGMMAMLLDYNNMKGTKDADTLKGEQGFVARKPADAQGNYQYEFWSPTMNPDDPDMPDEFSRNSVSQPS